MKNLESYIQQLQTDKQVLVNNLNEKGVEASEEETFTTLCPKVAEISGGGEPAFTGSYDSEGLAEIGYDEETINWYNQNGVVWNASDNDKFLLTQEDKDLYGVITTNNISNYKNQVIYVPYFKLNPYVTNNKFEGCFQLLTIPQLDTSNVTNMTYFFSECRSLISIPQLDTSHVTNMSYMFNNCNSLKLVPQLDTSNVTNMSSMFNNCNSLKLVPQLDTSNVTNMSSIFSYCYSLTSIPQLDTSNVTTMYSMFSECRSLITIPQLDTSNVTNMNYMFSYCGEITNLGGFENLGQAYLTTSSANYSNYTLNLSSCSKLTHDSLMNVINNLYDIATKGCNAQQLKLGSTNLAKLTDEEIAIATDKGWNVVA